MLNTLALTRNPKARRTGVRRPGWRAETLSAISSSHASRRLGCIGLTAQAVEVMQQGIEAAGSGPREEIDAATFSTSFSSASSSFSRKRSGCPP